MDFADMRQQGFRGFVSVGDLRAGRLSAVTPESGVYLAIRPDAWEPKFLEENPGYRFKRKDPTKSREWLKQQWVPGAPILYVGKTDRTLQTRIGEFLRFGEGKAAPHWGGRLLWQLDHSDTLLIGWRPSDRARAEEKELIRKLEARYRKLPFANIQR